MIHRAKNILKDVFGYDEFRFLQKEIIQNILHRNDTLVVLPTGSGKSLCYEIPALIFEGLTVVVSPLISLMDDQVKQLTMLGIEAAVLNSSLSYAAYRNNTERVLRNKIKLLYLAPETLFQQKTIDMLSSVPVDCLTIDEAHCISEWGHDFRPEYRQLAEARTLFPKAVCVALTATATPQVREDIQKTLGFENANSFVGSFDRPNLFLRVDQKINPTKQTLDFLEKFPNQSGIIYCATRKQVDEIYRFLMEEKYSVKPYHAGLSDEERRENQELFIRDDVQIMVATVAFGMGINKSNVRFILHYELPKNIESYYQQIGRAGRDGINSYCLLLFSYGDIQKIRFFINQKDPQEQRIATVHLNALIGLAETDECRRKPLLSYFGEEYREQKCTMCDNCTQDAPELHDVTIPAQKFLSCVKRTDEIFGAAHIIDILRGSKSQKVIDKNHHELSTYGIGKEYSKQQWSFLSRQFIQKDLLYQDMEYGSLKLTQKAWNVLRGNEKVHAKLEERIEKHDAKSKFDENYDASLFEMLRQKRKELADKNNVAPYVIFHDSTLAQMASRFPQSRASMMNLHGVGSVKHEKYGEVFLEIIQDYCQTNQIEETSKSTSVTTRRSLQKHISQPRHVVIGELYNKGKTLDDIKGEFNIKLKTVVGHLFKYISQGNSLRKSNDFLELLNLSNDEENQIKTAFDEHGTDYLKPVFDSLKEQVSYDTLHLFRLHYLTKS